MRGIALLSGLAAMVIVVGASSSAEAGHWVVRGYGGPVIAPAYVAPVPVEVVYPVVPAPVYVESYYAPVAVTPVEYYPAPAYGYWGPAYPRKTRAHFGPHGYRIRVRY